jgi:hypothetical protein
VYDVVDDEFPRSLSVSDTNDVSCYFEHYSRHILIEAYRKVLSKSLTKSVSANEPRSQSEDLELQRQRCKNLQRN